MSYHDLSDSGMSDSDRRAEATRILQKHRLAEQVREEGTPNEIEFVKKVGDERQPVSTKQLFWLRDLMEKYL